jgi:predicted RNA binding protein YcfA (HicA-like mRNA interferase family)
MGRQGHCFAWICFLVPYMVSFYLNGSGHQLPTMTSRARLLQKIQEKRGKNIDFNDLCRLLELYGFERDRISKSNHYYYVHPVTKRIVNVAKPHGGDEVRSVYVKDALAAIEELGIYDDE